jgi:hypothetical protein
MNAKTFGGKLYTNIGNILDNFKLNETQCH